MIFRPHRSFRPGINLPCETLIRPPNRDLMICPMYELEQQHNKQDTIIKSASSPECNCYQGRGSTTRRFLFCEGSGFGQRAVCASIAIKAKSHKRKSSTNQFWSRINGRFQPRVLKRVYNSVYHNGPDTYVRTLTSDFTFIFFLGLIRR